MKLLDYVAFGAATAQTPGFRLNTDALTLDYGDSEYIDLLDLERGSSGSSSSSGSDNSSEFFDDRDQLISMINHIISTEGGLPNLDRPATDYLNYGCWCNVLEDRSHARKAFGKSLDSLDLACQNWEQCLKCTQMDDTDCEPLLTDYSVLLGTVSSGGAYSPGSTATTSCDSNANGCGKWSCQCDARFASQFVAAIREGDFNKVNLHDSNKWDRSSMCAWTGDYDTHDECCGEYPKRFPFATNFGQRACCHNKTYNTNDATCCANGHISTTGTCAGPTTSTEAPTTPSPEPTTQEQTTEFPTTTIPPVPTTTEVPTTTGPIVTTTTIPPVTTTSESFFETFTTEKDSGNGGYNNQYAPAGPTTCQAQNLNIVFSVDISASMESVRDFWGWFRGFVRFFDFSKQKISINTFADDANVILDLAHHDSQHIMDTIFNLQQQGASSSQDSVLLKGMKTSRVSLKGLEGENSVVIVFTDGWNSEPKTPVFHGEEAYKDGINMISVGIGEKLMKEYLYTIATGNQRNVYEVKTDELNSITASLQDQICSSTSKQVFDSTETWTGARPDIVYDKESIAEYGKIYDKRGRLPNAFQDLNDDFLDWYRSEAQFGEGLMMRRLNVTMFGDI
ncbi:unnamed protein product [Oikopleura dioica]|uniref:VWFA domain-containing protein n=1 Tax=Oikopleura dioica TaxID=34765 RepID=E4XGF6_OIKDI|nr:unnamed protein product [Oikopleura dioica]